MKEAIREFFGFGDLGFTRPVEGFLSFEHLLFVTVLTAIMVASAIFIGRKYKNRTDDEKNKIIIITAFLIDGFELFKIVLHCIDKGSVFGFLDQLPLFLCSIQLITIPLAAFSKGRVKEAALDFVFIFGLLGAVLGTYGAGNNYSSYPVLSFPNVVSGITHCLSGFASLYIVLSGMASMKSKNIPITYCILSFFAICAYIANALGGYNYMFLTRGDGTPYDVMYNMVGGNKILYPIIVIGLLFLYIFVFNKIYKLVKDRRKEKEVMEIK